MEGSVLSFLKAEWKVSDTGSAHWTSSFTPARFKSCLGFFSFLLIYSKPCLLQLSRPYSTSLDFGIWLCIVGGTESLHGFPTDKNDRCVFTRDNRGEVMIFFEKNKVLLLWNCLAKWTKIWWEAHMEGSVLSFLIAEWKVSDTGSAHWASSFTPARFKSCFFFFYFF
jgi:hypothetical protein